MTVLVVASMVLLVAMLGISCWNLVAAPRLERGRPLREVPAVSLLVPARDEAANLQATLPTLLALDYPMLEILVLDDGSSDGTAEVVAAHQAGSRGRLRLLGGRPLPQGWLGKSWACHQLAASATGDIMVFLDADVRVRPDAVRHTVAAMREAGAGALTAIPRQRFSGIVDRAVVPLLTQLPVLALLPLPLVPRLGSPALSMANGQWLAFTRDAYYAAGGHAAVRDRVVEDVALGRRVKDAGQRLLVVVAAAALEVSMYPDGGAMREGFRKNLYPLVGGSPRALAAALTVFVLAAIVPFIGFALGVAGAASALALLLAVRVCGAILFRHGVLPILLHPVGSLLAVSLALDSFAGSRRGASHWKGRPVTVAAGAAGVDVEEPACSTGVARSTPE